MSKEVAIQRFLELAEPVLTSLQISLDDPEKETIEQTYVECVAEEERLEQERL